MRGAGGVEVPGPHEVWRVGGWSEAQESEERGAPS
jgi:hypothetical protein